MANLSLPMRLSPPRSLFESIAGLLARIAHFPYACCRSYLAVCGICLYVGSRLSFRLVSFRNAPMVFFSVIALILAASAFSEFSSVVVWVHFTKEGSRSTFLKNRAT
jgi:hypothetical protein